MDMLKELTPTQASDLTYLHYLCRTNAMRKAAIDCLATGMTVKEIIKVIEKNW